MLASRGARIPRRTALLRRRLSQALPLPRRNRGRHHWLFECSGLPEGCIAGSLVVSFSESSTDLSSLRRSSRRDRHKARGEPSCPSCSLRVGISLPYNAGTGQSNGDRQRACASDPTKSSQLSARRDGRGVSSPRYAAEPPCCYYFSLRNWPIRPHVVAFSRKPRWLLPSTTRTFSPCTRPESSRTASIWSLSSSTAARSRNGRVRRTPLASGRRPP